MGTKPGEEIAQAYRLEEGIKEVKARIEKLLESKKCVLVGIAGGTGAGKTFVAQRLNGAVISIDRYYKKIERLDKGNWDKPSSLHLDLLRKNLVRLKQGLPARVPVWDYFTHSRKGFETMQPAKVIVVEGLHALHPKITGLLDLKVFVEAGKEKRLRRKVERDQKERGGWTRQTSEQYFHKVAEPMFAKHIEPARPSADLVIVT